MLLMLAVIVLGAVLAPWISGLAQGRGVFTLVAVPGVALAMLINIALGGDATGLEVHDWIPGLGIAAAFRLDGLSLLMAGLVLGIGVLIVAYAARYLEGDPRQPRFMATLLLFMTAMLGLVLADDVILLFIFWELTSLTSYLLIGFDHTQEKARKAALQGLVVTVAGGLCLLVGLIIFGGIAGTYRLSEWPGLSETLISHPWSGWALLMVVLGCVTKSAQFPFHFWLPNAMAAPTPVSAYLHSATMVKAGVFLLARLHPTLGAHPGWAWLVPLGAFTAVFAALMAFRSDELKKVLAYTTVMALGTLTLLIGMGEAQAAVTFLLAHALYKGALFMLAGIITHETGAKALSAVAGMRRLLPWTWGSALLAAASAAGLMPWFGFIAKELLLASALDHSAWVTGAAIVAAGVVGGMLITFALRPFMGPSRAPKDSGKIHEAGAWLLAGPVVLASLGLTFGLVPGLADGVLLDAARAVGASDPTPLALWHGVNQAFLASLSSLAIAAVVWWLWPRTRRLAAGAEALDRVGPEQGYDALLTWVQRLATEITARLQSGLLRRYVAVTLLSTIVLLMSTLFLRSQAELAWPMATITLSVPIALAVGILVMAIIAIRVTDALSEALILGAVGFGIALLYMWFSAPDLAITQVMIETLTTILLVLILFRLPRMRQLSKPPQRYADLVLATVGGGVLSLVLWQVMVSPTPPAISEWLIAESVPGGHGRNIVNVILVDFRALDTLGEIFVLALAAVGVYALLKSKPEPGGDPS
ncbi:hydrogen gas-evolving membrane-bound hydrogenase subunit E [Polycyclovorans algicola]|uniref:hydrogen gas-evolving membrane-bound hydrogenase subunit E n=1 Tax=Polycyclovorans algicola TaxID=616992 RepID=UPI0004A6A957|nr:hydrogen gas-evolving membrane-bound hydrogenase subunit E [Polycyclovorans algicola]